MHHEDLEVGMTVQWYKQRKEGKLPIVRYVKVMEILSEPSVRVRVRVFQKKRFNDFWVEASDLYRVEKRDWLQWPERKGP